MAGALKKVVQALKPLKKTGFSGHHKPLSDDHAEMIESDYRRATSGHMAVRVGPQRYRFIMPTRFLNYPVFAPLLKMTEEQFGFQASGELVIPCEAKLFKEVLNLLHKNEKKFGKMSMEEFLKMISADQDQGFQDPCCSRQAAPAADSSSFTPLSQLRSSVGGILVCFDVIL